VSALACIFGFLIAALFAILAHGGSHQIIAGQASWIDLTFWAIVIAGAAPMVVGALREGLRGRRHRLNIPPRRSMRKIESL
jgi:hypothetical protein